MILSQLFRLSLYPKKQDWETKQLLARFELADPLVIMFDGKYLIVGSLQFNTKQIFVGYLIIVAFWLVNACNIK